MARVWTETGAPVKARSATVEGLITILSLSQSAGDTFDCRNWRPHLRRNWGYVYLSQAFSWH